MASVPPNLIAIRKGSKEIQLNWDQPPPTAKTIGYTIEYQSHRGESIGVDIDLSSTSYQVTGLMNGIRYNVAFISRSNHYYQRISIPIAMGKHTISVFFLVQNLFNPRRACAARVIVVVLSACLPVRASSSTTGYEAANEWHQRVVNDEKIDINAAIFPKRVRSRDMA